ncbi:hypothetical protein ACQB60_08005 [Actinomycetota bacterium Odt1-20B]
MRRGSRVATTALVVLALAAVSPGLAQGQPATGPAAGRISADTGDGLPAGWDIEGSGAARQLVWTAPKPQPVGNSRVEFYAGNDLLGQPVAAPDRRTYRLPLHGAGLGPAKDLRALAGGRRLDAAAGQPDARTPGLAPSAKPPTRGSAADVDPGKPGDYRTASGEYTLKSVRLPGFPAPVEMQARVIGPVDAPGKRPLALFLHGRHYTCYGGSGDGDGSDLGWPCKAGAKPVPSYEGYLGAQKLLASQGYVTVSISANGINAQDGDVPDGGAQARSSLVRRHLARWADWAKDQGGAPDAVRAVAPADLDQVLLVGHSRGGEGVNRAALDSQYKPPVDQDGAPGPVRWKIRGNVLIGPTIFGQNPAPDVPSVTILPGCDGDVNDLQGELYTDGTRGVSRGRALHSSVYVVGANHNFFNSEWTPGQSQAPADDDFGAGRDPVCSVGKPTRLKATQQQTVGNAYIAAAARLFVAGDDRARPLLDGTGRSMPSAGPARVLTHAVGGHRTTAVLPGSSVSVRGGGRLCAQVSNSRTRSCLWTDAIGSSPHFAAWDVVPEPGRDAVAMKWTRAGAPSATRITPARPFSLAGADALALRVIVPPNTTGTKLDVAVTDASGRTATLGKTTVDGLPGSRQIAAYWGREIRVPVSASVGAKVDLGHLKTLRLTPRSAKGTAWLMDAWGWRPGTPAVTTAALPRVDFGRLKVKEGDSGVRTYRMPVRVSGQGVGRVRLFVPEPGSDRTTSRTVTVRPGSHALDVPVEVRGDKRYGYDVTYSAGAKAVRGAVVGSYQGGVTVLNDDPLPRLTVKPVAGTVVEGKRLKWRVTLAHPVDVDIQGQIGFLPVRSGAELSTKDVDRTWLRDNLGQKPDPERALSAMPDDPTLFVSVPAGKTSVDVSVPTAKDRVREPAESLRARLSPLDQNYEPLPGGPEFTGKVKDAS